MTNFAYQVLVSTFALALSFMSYKLYINEVVAQEPTPAADEAEVVAQEPTPAADDPEVVVQEPTPAADEAEVVVQEPTPAADEADIMTLFFAHLRAKNTQLQPQPTINPGRVYKNPELDSRFMKNIKPINEVLSNDFGYDVVWVHDKSKGINSHGSGKNGFVLAVHRAFMDHHGIEITPDMIWFIVAQQMATYINFGENSKKLGSKLGVTHEGSQELIIMSKSEPIGSKDFSTSYPRFAEAISAKVGSEKYEMFVKSFTTTTDLEFGAFQIILMDAYKSYFEYTESTRCGIAEFCITGTAEDYSHIIAGVQRFATLDPKLKPCADGVIQLVDKLRSAVMGSFDDTYFDSFYHWESMSGFCEVTGHIKDLFLFKQTSSGISLLEPDDKIELGNFPSCISKAPFKYEDDKIYLLEFVAGCAGYEFTNGVCRPRMFTSVVHQK